jgi:predicted nucleic acid-binding protein
MIVVDTNIVVYLLIPGDRTREVRRLFLRDPDWAAPLLWRSELLSVLATYIRTGRFSLEIGMTLAGQAEQIFNGKSFAIASRQILEVAAKNLCSACDAEFIALAEQLRMKLFTYDAQILRRCPSLARRP